MTAPSTLSSFAPGAAEKIGYYVYLLIDPRDGTIFYIGKGTGDRCFAHVAEARTTLADAVGDFAKLARIREIKSSDSAVRIDILRHGLAEHEAFLVESAAIDLVEDLTNRVVGHDTAVRGRMSVSDVNALYGAVPVEIDPSHCVALIRINRRFEHGMTDEDLYEATRKWWKVGPQKRQIGAPGAPRWAMAVYKGIVRAVYRIDAWEQPSEGDIAADPKRSGRWGFRGTRDVGMEAAYLHRDVSDYLRRADTGNPSQTPVRYVNCAERGGNRRFREC